ncbi:helix-turn-helix domain-containing protein [Risungbinella massiliensis]|uniref:helix-turn-helix domain-containing protein n=1 Tax=Risungbinella massiliensis TaxID=1329796 RepID=UPI0005CC5C59|nr:helix-turn-helix transcriptional regulator [Risungbinella massiliensis]
MNGKDLLMIGEAIRDYRKQKGLRLEDLADEHISISTISNIERGFTHVKEGKLAYLLEKLGVQFQDLTQIESVHQKKERILSVQMIAIRSWIESGNGEKAYLLLKQMNLVDSHPQKQFYLFLKGLYFYHRNLFKKAKNEWNAALRLGREKRNQDLEATIYLYLGKISEHEGDVAEALYNVCQGLESYEQTDFGEHAYIALSLDQIRYLRQLDRDWEAMLLLNDLWTQIPKVDSISLRLEFYLQRAELLASHGVWSEAQEVVEAGLELARENREWGLMAKLWHELGIIHEGAGDIELARISYQSVGVIEQKFQTKPVLVSSLILLASLHYNQQDFTEAEKLLQKALQLAEKENRPPYILQAYLQLGDVAQALGDFQMAEERYQQAFLRAEKYGLDEKETEALIRLAKLAKERDMDKYQAYALQILEKQTEKF